MEENRIKPFYLCDGKVESCCKKEGCYRNGGPCDYTSDVSHARNFHIEKTSDGIVRSIREKKAAPENEILL